MTWALWIVLLLAQQASQTTVSRARNSGSLGYHAIASVGSNGIWLISQFILVNEITAILRSGDWARAVPVALIYVTACVSGSVGMHWWLQRRGL